MLSISPPRSAADALQYFRDHLQSQVHGDSAPGIWLGHGADALDLDGPVLLRDLTSLLIGTHPRQMTKLVQNAGDNRRRAAWDLTWNAPKSVSIAWGLGTDAEPDAIEQAHHVAVSETMEWLEKEHLVVRRGKGGKRKDKAKMIAARFTHHTSRAMDPQLHSHCLLLNIGYCSGAHWGAIETRPIFQSKMAAGALYRNILRRQLEIAGWETEANDIYFRLAAIPQELEAIFSKRRAQILATLEEWNASSTYAAQRATLYRRPEKRIVNLAELREQWINELNHCDLAASMKGDSYQNSFPTL
jgi:conjugative relaxase-like TrwC/TraI family protein